ncbi:MAG: hypothetical protein IME98_02365, partial [Proteobacteria bacterium]|nr:hypothetical protein [Pseudomonadota bacterium]
MRSVLNNTKNLFFIVLMLSLALGFIFVKQGSAKGSSREVIKKEKNLEDINKRLREGTKSLEGLSDKETSILSELSVINKRLNAVRADVKRLKGELKSTEGDIKQARARLAELTAEREELSERLKKRLRAIYMIKSGGAVRVLFSSVSTE